MAVGQASTTVTLTGTSSAGSGFWDPGAGTCHVRLQAAVGGGVIVNSATFVDATHLTLDLDTSAASTGSRTITVTNPDGQTASAAVLTVSPRTPPSNVTLPSVSGTAAVGSTLTASTGTWDETPAFTYQWRRCDTGGASCSDFAGATASTYPLVQADAGSTIRVRVTATNAGGSASADSSETAVVTGAPVNSALPTLSGTAASGRTLTTTDGSWTGYPAPSFTYAWLRCDTGGASCVSIAGATSTTYLLGSADVGQTIRSSVAATNASGSATAQPAQTAIVAGPPVNTALPSIRGSAQVGSTLTAGDGTWGGYPAPAFTYQWRRCDTSGASCVDIAGATASTYLLVQDDAGNTIRVRVTGTNASGASSADSPPTVTPPFNPAPTVKRVGTKALTGTRRGSAEFVTARFSVSEAAQLRMSVTRLGATKKPTLLKGSRLAAATAASRRLVLAARVTHAGTFTLRPVLVKASLVKGKTYVIRLTATDAGGKRATLTIASRHSSRDGLRCLPANTPAALVGPREKTEAVEHPYRSL